MPMTSIMEGEEIGGGMSLLIFPGSLCPTQLAIAIGPRDFELQ